MNRYLISFTPLEPYFFGGERNLSYPGENSLYRQGYYIRSEELPSPTTILGAIRFLLLRMNGRKPEDTGALTAEEQALIGPDSFDPDAAEPQSFGAIRSVSPLLLLNRAENDDLLIPVPPDHRGQDGAEYTPFAEYAEAETADGRKIYTEEYDAKAGPSSGWVSLRTRRVISRGGLFSPVLRTGINRGREADGYFKKEYKRLKEGYAFAVYCDLEGAVDPGKVPDTVFLGQGKSSFRVSLAPAEGDPAAETGRFFASHPLTERYALIYVLGDAMITDGEDRGIYDGLLFAASGVRDFRTIRTVAREGRIHKQRQASFRHLLQAGSLLAAANREAAEAWIGRNACTNSEQIGMNQFVVLEGKAR